MYFTDIVLFLYFYINTVFYQNITLVRLINLLDSCFYGLEKDINILRDDDCKI